MAEVPISEDMHRGTALNSLKYAAIAAMTVDHIAYAFVPNGTVLALVMHFFGRITGPVMFFSAVEGYHHTRNLTRYLFRLAAFAAISWFPFLYFCYGGDLSEMAFMRPNVIYTIFMGVLAIKIRRSERIRNPAIRASLILVLVILCVPADWGCTGIIMILVFDWFYGDFRNQAFAYCMVVLLDMGVLSLITRPFFGLFYDHVFQIDLEYFMYSAENLGAFLPVILLSQYNGRRGGGKLSKWFFYLYYPTHLLLLGMLQAVL